MQTVYQVVIETAKQNVMLTTLLAILPTMTGGIITVFQDLKNQRTEKRKAQRSLYAEVRENTQDYLFQINSYLTNLNNIQKYGSALSAVCSPIKNELFLSKDINNLDWHTTIAHLHVFCKNLFQNLDCFSSTDLIAQFYIDFIKMQCFQLLNPNLIVDVFSDYFYKIITPVRMIGGTLQIKVEELENFISLLTQGQMENYNLWDIKDKLVEFIIFVEGEIKKL